MPIDWVSQVHEELAYFNDSSKDWEAIRAIVNASPDGQAALYRVMHQAYLRHTGTNRPATAETNNITSLIGLKPGAKIWIQFKTLQLQQCF